VGYDYVHVAVDDCSRLAYVEVLGSENGEACAGFLRRAAAFFAAHGLPRIERVMTDNATAYTRSRLFAAALGKNGGDEGNRTPNPRLAKLADDVEQDHYQPLWPHSGPRWPALPTSVDHGSCHGPCHGVCARPASMPPGGEDEGIEP
jgi:hypothetical protein